MVAETGGPTMGGGSDAMKAPNRHVERVFDSSRKDHH
jgi:hypothetical protein